MQEKQRYITSKIRGVRKIVDSTKGGSRKKKQNKTKTNKIEQEKETGDLTSSAHQPTASIDVKNH